MGQDCIHSLYKLDRALELTCDSTLACWNDVVESRIRIKIVEMLIKFMTYIYTVIIIRSSGSL